MAQLGEKQLSFERQQPNLGVIKTDYWQPPSPSTTTQLDNTGTSTDTRGLTGSARLLEDVTQLDRYAFLTDTRKLQLTKTISLARLVPRNRRCAVLHAHDPFRSGLSRDNWGIQNVLLHFVHADNQTFDIPDMSLT